MHWKVKLDQWMSYIQLDDTLKSQLQVIQEDEKLLEDSFYKELEFGTGGMRGEMGPGTNRMNIYTVRKAAEGLAQYVLSQGKEAVLRGVVIAYDSRHLSAEFALETAKTMGRHGIRTYMFGELHPTPLLSFAVRYLHAYAGVMITASHNPPEYNGLKIYAEDGSQISPAMADEIIDYVKKAGSELTVETASEQELIEKDLLTYIGHSIDQAYIRALNSIRYNQAETNKEVSIVFTPLHGAGNKPVRAALQAFGFENVRIVKEQELPHPDFPTVVSPNPEEHEAFKMAICYGEERNADILIGTDPDADRLGVAVKSREGKYIVLTGNQIGALMLHYLLAQKKRSGTLPENGVIMKTIVTSEIGREIAAAFGILTVDTLTGFKFIGEKMKEFEQSGEHTFLFGYEESYGYLIGDFVRDKDAVQAAVCIAEVAADYKRKGKSLYEGLMELFETYGFYQESLRSLTLKGKEGAEKIAAIMEKFRTEPLEELNGIAVIELADYQTGEYINKKTGLIRPTGLPKSNVLKLKLADHSWVCIRPSGTEPKVKIYFGVKGKSIPDSQEKLAGIEKEMMSILHHLVRV
ncbi:phospho-sugar mutase [Bacillus sp. PK3_68]|uniref:phospho-sugar mutase n=1 Tax=Bacillus sp. PK3_68 TaxID=2027408 RepID=UPI000E71B106|nr:phospho-sugar mutase [Bacillus sp. PK3_68]RJS58689.1 phosphoglucomutase [Bacillus sp. PK3_68]